MMNVEKRCEGCPLLDGAKRFVLEVLESTPPTRRVEVRGPRPPTPPPQPGSFEYQLLAYFQNRGQTRDLWGMMSAALQEDRDVAMTAFVGEHARIDDLPLELRCDRDFLLQAVRKNSQLWLCIPSKFQLEGDFFELLSIRSDDMAFMIFQQHPHLREDRRIWEREIIPYLGRLKDEGFKGYGEHKGCSLVHAPTHILSDKNLMITACSKREAELGRVDPLLLRDVDFVQKIITLKPLGLMFLPQQALTALPDFVEKMLPAFMEMASDYPPYYCSKLLSALGPQHLDRPTFAKAWFCSGGDFYTEFFPEEWKDREDIFLWIAEHGSNPHIQFQHATDRLKGKLDFMILATEFDVQIYNVAADSIKDDFELVLRYISKAPCHARTYVNREESAEWSAKINNLRARLLDSLQLYYRFLAFFLRPLSSVESPWKKQCPVSKLNQGSDTSLKYKKLVGEYLGILGAKELWLYFNAYRNILDASEES